MKSIILISYLLLFSLQGVWARGSKTDTTIKVGLVLSGGSARGLAHIGVLKVLEETGITPDYITGTSMGAVIGSLYALGYSADEISELTHSADWDFLLSDRLPLNKVAYEEKDGYNQHIGGLCIQNNKLFLPSGMIEGQQLEKLFTKLMWPLQENISFDSLPIPFRCLATDLLSGELIELSSGNLAQAIRASMAIPSVFAPQHIDTMLLIDGGTMRSFPVEEVRQMGAEVVIGVYVGFEDQPGKEDIVSLSDILSRSTVLGGINDSRKQSEKVDVLIVPDMKGCNPGDFRKSVMFEELGRIAALEHLESLSELSDSIKPGNRNINKHVVPERITLNSIKVENNSSQISDRFVIAHSGIQSGDQVSETDLSQAIDNIYGTRYFRKVSYSLEKEADGTYNLLLKVKETSRGCLNFAGHYSNQYKPELIVNLNLRNFIIPETKTSLTINISEDPDIHFDINKYFGKRQRLMKTGFVHWNLYDNYMYEEGIDLGAYSMNALRAGVGGKYSFSANHQFGINIAYEKQVITPRSNLKNFFNTMSFEEYGFKGFSFEVSFQVNTLDDKYFPKSGTRLNFWHKHYINPNVSYTIDPDEKEIVKNVVRFRESNEDFTMTYFNFEHYTSLLNTITFSAGITTGSSTEPSIGMGNFVIGGLHNDRRSHYVPFAGKQFAEDIATTFVILKSGLDILLYPGIYLSGKINFLNASKELITLIETMNENIVTDYQMGYCAGFKADTFIGPICAMVGKNENDHSLHWYFNFGYSF